MTVEDVKIWLKQIRGVQKEINQLKREKQRLWDELTNITGGLKERVQTSAVNSNDKVLKHMEYENLLMEKLTELVELKITVEAAIEKLPQNKYRRLLRSYYVDGLTWEETADELGVDVRSVHRIHGKALMCLVKIL